MGVADDKKKIFTTIGAYTSLNEQGKMPDTTNLYPSVNNQKEIIPFLLDVIGVVVGTEALKGTIGEVLTKFVDTAEPKAKEAIKKQFNGFNSDQPMPSTTQVEIPTSSIDFKSKFKTSDPETTNVLFDGTTINYDTHIMNTIRNAGTDSTFNGLLTTNYNSITDKLTLTPVTTTKSTITIGTWFSSFVDQITVINKKELVTNVMDVLYGSVSSSQNKTVEQLKKELTVSKSIQQLIENNNDTFVVDPKFNDEIQKKAEEMSKGIITYDMGCGLITASLDISGLTTLVSTISGSTDPFVVGNAVDDTVTKTAISNSPDAMAENSQTIRDGFFKRLINAILQVLVEALTLSPQIRSLLAIYSSIENNGQTLIDDVSNDLKKFNTFIKCNTNEMSSMLNEFIFSLIVTALVALLMPIIKKIIKEKTNQYVETIKSLSPIQI